MALKKWFFTWGLDQGHDNCYTIIEAESRDAAREIMIRVWGTRWCGQYSSAEAAGIPEYRLKYIKTMKG